MRFSQRWFACVALFASGGLVFSSCAALAAEPHAASIIAVANAPDAAVEPSPALDSSPENASAQSELPDRKHDDGVVTIVLGGDLGLGGSNQSVIATGAFRHGKKMAWSELTSGIAPLFDGDINFANLESVVTDRNDLRANPKAFTFKSHPAGIAHLTKLGINVVSTANNHALDYGEAGLRETLRHLETAATHGLAAWPGIGDGREQASRPADVTVKGTRVRISAIGIGGGTLPANDANASRTRTGMLHYNRADDYADTVARLAETEGDLRILSVHYGAELQVRAGHGDVLKLRDQAAKAAGIDIVVGHHAHVAAGVQINDGRLVLYGLGNLLHPGMQDMSRFGVCRDYGLVVRAHYARDTSGKLALRAVEAIALTEMHARAKPREGEAGRMRIEVLNHLAGELEDANGATGVRFTPRADGTGLYCLPGADVSPGSIGEMCKGWQAPPLPPRDVAQRIAASCGGALIAQRRDGSEVAAGSPRERARISRHKPATQKDSTLLTSIFGW